MADTKISALPSGAPALATDETVIARGGANYKLTLTNIAASMPPIGATTPNTGAFTTLSASGNASLTTLSASGAASFADGSVSAPAVTNTGNTDTGVYFPAANEVAVSTGGTVAAAFNSNGLFFRNRIINGNMRIDQRNAGAAVTVNSANNFYAVDRFFGSGQVTDGVFTVQQSTTAPTNFTNSIIATVTTADASLGATQQYIVGQAVEGFNAADLRWGTANALTVTLSFWVRSSLTGTFGGSLVNSGFNRSYPFTYSISSANTWEQKTVTIAGDTSGTWLTDNGVGIRVLFSLGAGSTYAGTAGAWDGSYKSGATGQTQVIGTLNATWYVTGVQLETGSVATPFERRPYTTELQLCQRYYAKTFALGTKPADNAGSFGNLASNTGTFSTGAALVGRWQFPVAMRAAPTITFYNPTTGTAGFWGDVFGTGVTYNPGSPAANEFSAAFANASTGGTTLTPGLHVVASIEL
jgi:hypothetical protein